MDYTKNIVLFFKIVGGESDLGKVTGGKKKREREREGSFQFKTSQGMNEKTQSNQREKRN